MAPAGQSGSLLLAISVEQARQPAAAEFSAVAPGLAPATLARTHGRICCHQRPKAFCHPYFPDTSEPRWLIMRRNQQRGPGDQAEQVALGLRETWMTLLLLSWEGCRQSGFLGQLEQFSIYSGPPILKVLFWCAARLMP